MKIIALEDPSLKITYVDKIDLNKVYLYVEDLSTPTITETGQPKSLVLILVPRRDNRINGEFTVVNYLHDTGAEEWDIDDFRNLLKYALTKPECKAYEFDTLFDCIKYIGNRNFK